jgi:hypothetical protein
VACVDNAKPQTDTELSSGVGIKEVYKEISSSNSNILDQTIISYQN